MSPDDEREMATTHGLLVACTLGALIWLTIVGIILAVTR